MRVMRSIYKQKKKKEIILLYRRKIVKIKQTRLKLYQIYKLQGLKKSQPRLLESETMVCHSTSQQLLKNMQKQTQMPKEMNTIKSQTKHILYEYQRKRTYFSQYNNSGEAKKVQHDSIKNGRCILNGGLPTITKFYCVLFKQFIITLRFNGIILQMQKKFQIQSQQ